jgi:hypothetical protein
LGPEQIELLQRLLIPGHVYQTHTVHSAAAGQLAERLQLGERWHHGTSWLRTVGGLTAATDHAADPATPRVRS